MGAADFVRGLVVLGQRLPRYAKHFWSEVKEIIFPRCGNFTRVSMHISDRVHNFPLLGRSHPAANKLPRSPLPGPPTMYDRLNLKGKLWVMRHIHLCELRERRRRRFAALRALASPSLGRDQSTEKDDSDNIKGGEKESAIHPRTVDISNTLRGMIGSLAASTPEERKVMLLGPSCRLNAVCRCPCINLHGSGHERGCCWPISLIRNAGQPGRSPRFCSTPSRLSRKAPRSHESSDNAPSRTCKCSSNPSSKDTGENGRPRGAPQRSSGQPSLPPQAAPRTLTEPPSERACLARDPI